MKTDRVNTSLGIVHLEIQRNKNFPNSNCPYCYIKMPWYFHAKKIRPQKSRNRFFFVTDGVIHGEMASMVFITYHSNTHECMAICLGSAKVMLGGPGGKKIELTKALLLFDLPAWDTNVYIIRTTFCV